MAVKTGDINMNLADSRIVIVADGSFPEHKVPLAAIDEADFIICCDGAAASLVEYGKEPAVIIGDLDSLSPGLAARFADRLVEDSGQETNDLTKAVRWCVSGGTGAITIVGATGKREDHTLGNISLLAEYAKSTTVKMLTDTGTLFPVYGVSDNDDLRQANQSTHVARQATIKTFPGQRVSIFSLDSNTRLTATGLEYPAIDLLLDSWWRATLNRATGQEITLSFTSARLIIYLGH